MFLLTQRPCSLFHIHLWHPQDQCLILECSLLQQELALAVLPETVAVPETLKIGDKIVLNAVLTKKMLMRKKGGDPALWARYVLKSYLKGKTEL